MCIYNVGIISVSLIYIYIINGEWINLYVCVYNSCYDIAYIYISQQYIVVVSENVELSRNMSMLMGNRIIPPVD